MLSSQKKKLIEKNLTDQCLLVKLLISVKLDTNTMIIIHLATLYTRHICTKKAQQQCTNKDEHDAQKN